MTIFNFNFNRLWIKRQERASLSDAFLLFELVASLSVFVLMMTIYSKWNVRIFNEKKAAGTRLVELHQLHGIAKALVHNQSLVPSLQNFQIHYKPITYFPHAATMSKYQMPTGMHVIGITHKQKLSFSTIMLKRRAHE